MGGVATDARGTIIVADDSLEMRDLVCTWLRRAHREATVVAASTGREVLEVVRSMVDGAGRHRPIVVISDYRMPGIDGIALVDAMRAFAVPCIVMTGFGDAQMHERFAAHGAWASFDKPLDLDRLAAAAADALLGARAA
jgi:two-component system C4-dicarboxylate transport response regulator DctD